MARIVKLTELLPEDFVFEYAPGQQITLPGDPPLELILMIGSLFERAESSGEQTEGLGLEILEKLNEQVLRLIQMRNPDIQSSPFGIFGVQHVVSALLETYNFGVAEPEAEGEDPPKGATKKSPRSRGSRSS